MLLPFLLLMTANLVVLTCWTVLAPLRFVRVAGEGTDEWSRPVSSTGSCVSDTESSLRGIPYLAALVAINLSVVVLANIQAYRARNIKTEYSESRYIALIMLFLLQSWLTGIPVLALVHEMPEANYIVITNDKKKLKVAV